MNPLLFVYGTLKRGCSNHHLLTGQIFVGPARTQPGYRLYDLGGFPGIAACAADRKGVAGEVWSIDAATLRKLDEFEGTHEGLYRREPLPLRAPFAAQRVEAYVPVHDPTGGRDVGSEWLG